MIIVVLKNPEPQNLVRKGVNSEVRILVEGMTLEEGDNFGKAIRRFADTMAREFTAFKLENELVPHER